MLLYSMDSKSARYHGTSMDPEPFVTRTVVTTGSRLAASAVPASHGGQFVPGTVISDRYRIIAPLGRGGMGEVYRADDLTLGQQVALKFLPAALARNEDAMRRFRNEVRVARQVSHPNVCRECLPRLRYRRS